MNRCVAAPAEEVRSFCEQVSASAAQNLDLLRKIEQTVDWLVLLQDTAAAHEKFANSVAERVKACDLEVPLDPGDELTSCFEKAESTIEKLHAVLVDKRESAIADPDLRGDHEAAVVEEFTRSIAAVADLHSAVTDLRWSLLEHDADVDKERSEAFESVADLMASLRG